MGVVGSGWLVPGLVPGIWARRVGGMWGEGEPSRWTPADAGADSVRDQ